MRTIFNLLGPLSNPAGVRRQFTGAFAREWIEPMARVLGNLGSERAWVVHGSDGLDELTTTGPSWVAEWKTARCAPSRSTPADAGLPLARPEDLQGRRRRDQRRSHARHARRRAWPVPRRRRLQRGGSADRRRPRRATCGRAQKWRPMPWRLVTPGRRWTGWSKSPTGRRRQRPFLDELRRPDVGSARICADKRALVARPQARAPAGGAGGAAAAGLPAARLRPRLCACLSTPAASALIAEIKRASPSQRADPRRLRSAGAGPRLCRGRRHLPVGADRRTLVPGRRQLPGRRTMPRCRCRCCARTSCWSLTRSSRRGRSAPTPCW